MVFQNNIISLDGSKKVVENRFSLQEASRGVINECRQILHRALPRLLEGMFENLDDALYELADKADNNRLQTSYFDAMRNIRKGREQIEARFNGRILECYDHFWKQGPGTGPWAGTQQEQNADTFSLVDEGDLEEALAVGNMISRGENRYYKEIYALNQRFSHLLGGMEVDEKSNPLAPAFFCNAFNSAAQGVELEITVKLVVYKQFERRVVDELGNLYRDLNEHLARGGILPALVRKVRRSPRQAPLPAPGKGNLQDARDTAEGGYGYAAEGDDLQAELFATLQQLLGQRRVAAPPPAVQSRAQLPVADRTEIIAALSALQQNGVMTLPQAAAVGQTEADVRASLIQVMQSGMGSDAAKKISQNDEDAIDVISMLFEFILEDRNLPDAMKALLGRLQIPMLKVAILDKSFFSKKQHPARRLLNSLAHAGIGWSEGRGRAEGGLYAKMEYIVESVISGFENELGLFDQLSAELARFMEEEDKGSKITEQRAAQVTQGKEQLQMARRRVFQEINERLFGHDEIPDVAVALLKEGWKDVLLLIYLRKSEESPEWRNALHLMDRLIWSVQPKEERAQRQQLLKEMPILLKGLRNGLSDISYDQHKMAQLFQALHDCHVRCLKGGVLAGDVPTVDLAKTQGREEQVKSVWSEREHPVSGDGAVQKRREARDKTPESTVASPVSAAKAAPERRDRFLEQADKLKIGSWLEVAEEDGTSTRAKLSWRSQVSGNCLFVNRKGMKVAEISLSGLATWFRSGRATELEEVGVPLMDRALTAMVDVLKAPRKGSH
jgi:hypothetical protein